MTETKFRCGQRVRCGGLLVKLGKKLSDSIFEVRTLDGSYVGVRHVTSLRRADKGPRRA